MTNVASRMPNSTGIEQASPGGESQHGWGGWGPARRAPAPIVRCGSALLGGRRVEEAPEQGFEVREQAVTPDVRRIGRIPLDAVALHHVAGVEADPSWKVTPSRAA